MTGPRELERLRLIAILGLLAFAMLLSRLAVIQLLDHGEFSRKAAAQQQERVILEAERGRIYDRHMRPLADNVALSELSVRPTEVVNARATRRFLERTVGSRGLEKLRRSGRATYVRISRRLTPEQEMLLASSSLPNGVHAEAVPSRVYPLDQIGRQVIGVVGDEGIGLEGIERTFDRELRGVAGWATLFRDGRGLSHQLPQSLMKMPEPGGNLVSTIDRDAQSIVVMKLREAVARTGAKAGMAVFADPNTGDILAMATVEGAAGSDGGRCRNRVIADQFEPGSTFKILAGCAALEERILVPEDSFYVAHGEADLGGFVMHDAHPETGWLSLREATARSSNVCYAQVGIRVGASTLYRYARLFGFGQPTRIALPGEAPGQIRHPSRWSARSLATIAIGQEVMATPLQTLMAYCAVANGGTLLRPRIATALLDEEGTPMRSFPVERVRRVISEGTASTFRSFLRDAVVQGTAAEAALPWCEVAGKTGTAQKTADGGRGYEIGRYLSSFVGMIPADKPQLVGLIILDEPRGLYYGGTVAAPVFRDIVSTWATLGRGPVSLPAAVVVPEREAASLPAPAPVLALTAAVRPAEGGEATLPDVRGLTVRDALRRLTALDVKVGAVRGTGRVVDQAPEPGALLVPGMTCRLTCAARGM
jgi:cell division protein FtsI (penicillin-binding protein 3)